MATNFRNRVAVLGTALMLGMLGACANTGDRSVGAVVDDSVITTKVKSAFFDRSTTS
jgi:hypothetical protein